MGLPLLQKCPFCGSRIQHFIGHVSGYYAFYCTNSRKLIILDNELHEKIISSDSGLEQDIKASVRKYLNNHGDFEVYLSLEKIRKINISATAAKKIPE